MSRPTWWLVLALAGAATPPCLVAQYRPIEVPPAAPSSLTREAVDGPWLEDAVLSTVGAALGGVAGFYGLGLAGLYLTGGNDVCGDDPCGLVGHILGAVLGEAIGIGLGAYLGAGSRADPWGPIGASLGVLLLGGMATEALDLGEYMIVVVPVAQIAAAVWTAVSPGRHSGN